MGLRVSSTFLVIAVFVNGCAHYPVNAPLAAVDARAGYRFENAASPTNSQELLLMLAFSGGGTRAAALSYGVLAELARTEVGPPGEQHRLLDEDDAQIRGNAPASHSAVISSLLTHNPLAQQLRRLDIYHLAVNFLSAASNSSRIGPPSAPVTSTRWPTARSFWHALCPSVLASSSKRA